MTKKPAIPPSCPGCGLPLETADYAAAPTVRLILSVNGSTALELNAVLCEVCAVEASASMPAALEILREAAEELLDDAGGDDD